MNNVNSPLLHHGPLAAATTYPRLPSLSPLDRLWFNCFTSFSPVQVQFRLSFSLRPEGLAKKSWMIHKWPMKHIVSYGSNDI